MSKELVVSATRHETRVALIEDDQAVEIFYQREKEYSLAGSIHKGRVTRVLPGMQSAFVDIGLERDAFLYVSDFFEDNDEYDKVVTDVEEKVLRLEKGSGASTAAPTAVTASAVVESPGKEEVPPVTAPQAGNGQPAAASPAGIRSEERDSRDRRGHRSRRRRGKGRGIPESKYFSPRPRQEPPPAEAVETATAEEEFPILPGESLAKYGPTERVTETPDSAEASPAEESAFERHVSEPPAEESNVVLIVEETEDERAMTESAEETPAEERSSQFDADECEQPRAIREPEELNDQPPLASGAVELDEAAEPGTATSELTVAGEQDRAAEGEAAAAGTEEESQGEAAAEAASQEPEGPEPARIPNSLTATLREQGPRYLHRMSRRMRRKMRASGGAVPAEMQRPAEPVREAQAPELRTAEAPRPAPRPEKSGPPSIADLLREGQEIIVQIAKEPLGQKGARITSHIALPGRFLVYMPTVDHIGVSRKIPSDEERTRLKRILQAHHAGIPGGYIVRTAGEGRTEEELRSDMMFLYNLWLDIRQKAEKRAAPALIHHDLDVVQRILRDQLTSAFKTIWVDNEEVYENVLGFVQRFQPALVSRVKLYTRSTPIFDEFGITQELERALRPKVWLKSGGYIVINQTEALVAIDINTGKYVGKSNRLEDTIVKTNTDAVKEIVRQIRLRDLGGIIVVDFIDMDERKNRQKVMQALEEAMRADRAPYKILQFNDFGLVAITRKRVKQSLERTLCSPCPYCEGAGYVKSVQTVVGEILQEAQKAAGVLERGEVTLRVNPEVAKLLKSNRNNYLQELEEVLGRTVLVKSDAQMHQEKFDLA
ncbi:MAG TPA: Rne/Rng family ribonuclease [Bryobacteraceae bacterium]|nr:Rne/Rng family ribonuclease [Bryobacteraceae bacterium]